MTANLVNDVKEVKMMTMFYNIKQQKGKSQSLPAGVTAQYKNWRITVSSPKPLTVPKLVITMSARPDKTSWFSVAITSSTGPFPPTPPLDLYLLAPSFPLVILPSNKNLPPSPPATAEVVEFAQSDSISLVMYRSSSEFRRAHEVGIPVNPSIVHTDDPQGNVLDITRETNFDVACSNIMRTLTYHSTNWTMFWAVKAVDNQIEAAGLNISPIVREWWQGVYQKIMTSPTRRLTPKFDPFNLCANQPPQATLIASSLYPRFPTIDLLIAELQKNDNPDLMSEALAIFPTLKNHLRFYMAVQRATCVNMRRFGFPQMMIATNINLKRVLYVWLKSQVEVAQGPDDSSSESEHSDDEEERPPRISWGTAIKNYAKSTLGFTRAEQTLDKADKAFDATTTAATDLSVSVAKAQTYFERMTEAISPKAWLKEVWDYISKHFSCSKTAALVLSIYDIINGTSNVARVREVIKVLCYMGWGESAASKLVSEIVRLTANKGSKPASTLKVRYTTTNGQVEIISATPTTDNTTETTQGPDEAIQHLSLGLPFILTSLFCASLSRAFSFKDYAYLIIAYGAFSRAVLNINAFHKLEMESCMGICSGIKKIYQWLMDTESDQEKFARYAPEHVKQLTEWTNEVLECVKEVNADQLYVSAKARRHVQHLAAQGATFFTQFVRGKAAPPLIGIINQTRTVLSKVVEIADRVDTEEIVRPTPVVVILTGDAGCGKSTAANKIRISLSEALGIDHTRPIFHVNYASKFDDINGTEYVAVADEHLLMQSPEIAGRFISMVSCNPYRPEGAFVKDKSLNLRLYLGCTNTAYPTFEKIDEMAVWRREMLKFEVRRKRDDKGTPAPMDAQFSHLEFKHICCAKPGYEDKVPIELRHNAALDWMNFDQFEYYVCKKAKELSLQFQRAYEVALAAEVKDDKPSLPTWDGKRTTELTKALLNDDIAFDIPTERRQKFLAEIAEFYAAGSPTEGKFFTDKGLHGTDITAQRYFQYVASKYAPQSCRWFHETINLLIEEMKNSGAHEEYIDEMQTIGDTLAVMFAVDRNRFYQSWAYARLLKHKPTKLEPIMNYLKTTMERIVTTLKSQATRWYKYAKDTLLAWCRRHKLFLVTVGLVTLAVGAALYVYITKPEDNPAVAGLKKTVQKLKDKFRGANAEGTPYTNTVFGAKTIRPEVQDALPGTSNIMTQAYLLGQQIEANKSAHFGKLPTGADEHRPLAGSSLTDFSKVLTGFSTTQGATYQLSDAVFQPAMVSFYLTDRASSTKPFHGIAVRGRTYIVPSHCLSHAKFRLPGATHIVLTGKIEREIAMEDMQVEQLLVEDLTILRFTTRNLPMVPDLTKHFVREEQLGPLRSTKALLITPNFSEQRRAQYTITKLTAALNLTVKSYWDDVMNKIIHTTSTYSYGHSEAGACGSMLVADNDYAEGRILGFHVCGNENSGSAQIISYEMLSNIAQSPDDVYPQPIPTIPHEVQTMIEPGDNCINGILSSLDAPFISGKTKFRVMPIAGEVVPIHKEPAILSLADHRNTMRVPPLKAGVAKYSGIAAPWDEKFISLAVAGLKAEFDTYSYPHSRVLSLDEALNGIPGREFVTRLNPDSSPGYPFIKNSPDPRQTGKRPWLNYEGSEIVSVHSDLADAMEARRKLGIQGIRSNSLWMDCLKDELLEPRKIYDAVKTRVFDIPPMDYTILVRQHTLPFCEMLMENRHNGFVQLGIDAEGFDWTLLVRSLYAVHDKVETSDFKAYDGSHLMAILEAINEVIVHWASQDPEVAPSQIRFLRVLLQETAQRTVIAGRVVHTVFHGLPSGHPLTTVYNCIAQKIYFFLAWCTLAIECGKPEVATWSFFCRNVCLKAYGDDGLRSVNPAYLDFFNSTAIATFFSRHGLTMTPADKTAGFKGPQPIEECTFLSRGFVHHPHHPHLFLAPLKTISVNELLNWYRKGRAWLETIEEQVDQHMRFMYAYGKSAFDFRRRQINHALMQRSVRVSCMLTYEELDFQFLIKCGMAERTTTLAYKTRQIDDSRTNLV
nr:MAG: RNA-dependent RNA polymerase [Wufeng shrew picorna-like virus 28]